ncbi:conserved protein of unknown function [Limnospira indica PCC 8005]|uniref:Uncharacterized protein n=1 Tax=Limnospira indica PCC 8005 TaxID=376219 RepID=A0A9P1KAE6_9CYAN|nr:conserved protein of unknown function [Limnospira indica PCC 8005]
MNWEAECILIHLFPKKAPNFYALSKFPLVFERLLWAGSEGRLQEQKKATQEAAYI